MAIQNRIQREERLGNWKNVAELIDFKILKFAPAGGLLGIGKADVMLLYKKKPGESDKDQKRMIIFGPEDAVYQTALKKIRDKKNPQKALLLETKFKAAWTTTEYEQRSVKPSTLLNTEGYKKAQSSINSIIQSSGLQTNIGIKVIELKTNRRKEK